MTWFSVVGEMDSWVRRERGGDDEGKLSEKENMCFHNIFQFVFNRLSSNSAKGHMLDKLHVLYVQQFGLAIK